jgi:FlaA1/EpsC-like NDP-sugar epimerase
VLGPRLTPRRLGLALADTALWCAALVLLAHPRLSSDADRGHLWALAVTVVALALLVGGARGLYTGRWRMGSFEESVAVTTSVAATTAGALLLDVLAGRPAPMRGLVVAGGLALVSTVGLRWVLRRRGERRAGRPSDGAAKVLVFGAGEGGVEAIAAMLRDTKRAFEPVALLDDDPAKDGLRVRGVSVLGSRHDLGWVAGRTGASVLLVAIPSAGAELIRDLADRASAAGLSIRVLPALHELLGGSIRLADMRPPSYADLLGRREVELDGSLIRERLTGRRILVTGAGGSIGSELCRQISRLRPASLVMLDRDESALHAVQLTIAGHALLDSPELVVADIRDWQRLGDVFSEHQPEVVFHAAALKHLPLLEMHPAEAVKSNVWGTWNVLEAAANSGVERFVNISTDKAADPTSVLGSSKRAAERLTAWFDRTTDVTCLSVRFGNVLGSRGSVLTTFQSQIMSGRPVTVTHPDVTRYFMTVEEAVSLVLQAAAVGDGGEALVLDMGAPVRIADVARRLIEDAGADVEIVFTGLRPGEKLHEDLFSRDERDVRPFHQLISHVPVPPLAPGEVSRISCIGPAAAIAGALHRAATTVHLTAVPSTVRTQRRRGHGAGASHGGSGAMRRASDPLSAR